MTVDNDLVAQTESTDLAGLEKLVEEFYDSGFVETQLLGKEVWQAKLTQKGYDAMKG